MNRHLLHIQAVVPALQSWWWCPCWKVDGCYGDCIPSWLRWKFHTYSHRRGLIFETRVPIYIYIYCAGGLLLYVRGYNWWDSTVHACVPFSIISRWWSKIYHVLWQMEQRWNFRLFRRPLLYCCTHWMSFFIISTSTRFGWKSLQYVAWNTYMCILCKLFVIMATAVFFSS